MIKISDAELEVMKIIWERKKITSLEIIEELKGAKWKFNTIRTLIKRLENKGAIKILDKVGKAYQYIPVLDESKYKINASKDFLKKMYNNSFSELVLQYCESENVTKQEMKKIIEEIDKEINKKHLDEVN